MNIANLFGITDIVIVIFFIVMVLIGWKRGFLEQFIKIANMLFGFVFAILFAGQFAKFIGPLYFNDLIKPQVYENVLHSEAIQSINSNSVDEGVSNVLNEVGFPKVLSDLIGSVVSKNIDKTATELQHEIADAISTQLTKFIVVVIAFFLLLFGTTILFFILKIIVRCLRTSLVFKTVDGILGTVFMLIIFFVITYTFFIIVSVMLPMPELERFTMFMVEDMQLNSDQFRLSKYLYEHNIILNLFKVFFY